MLSVSVLTTQFKFATGKDALKNWHEFERWCEEEYHPDEQGGIIFILVLAMGAVCVCFFAFVLMVAVLMVGANPDDAGTTGGAAAAATWNEGEAGAPGAEESVDLRAGGLKCISLPGVKGTPAVDRRVYPWLMAANKVIRDEGRARLTYNWTFRTNAQQAAIKSTYGPKAPVNSSYHEAGAAVDVNGMPWGNSPRGDAHRIVEIFAAHRATWLGKRDPPHFQWNFDVLGEPSKYQMIRRAQEAHNRGDVEGNCLGGNRN